MKRILVLLMLHLAWKAVTGQQIRVGALTPTPNNQWASNLLANFIESHHVNINIQATRSQLNDALKRLCENDCSLILAVTGLELKGKRLDQSQVALEISTYTEINNKGFVIQRSFDKGNTDFTDVGFIPGKGNSITASKYGFIDENSFHGYSYYRVKQMDLDGKSSYSKIVRVNGYTQTLAVQVSPNPVSSGKIQVRILGFADARNNNVLITDARGSRVLIDSGLDFISESHTIDIRKLPPGWYFLKVFNQKEKATTSFIVN